LTEKFNVHSCQEIIFYKNFVTAKQLKHFLNQSSNNSDLFETRLMQKYLDSDGCLVLDLKFSIIFEVDGNKTIVHEEGNQLPLTKILPGEKQILDSVKSLFGDEKTSDVVIKVMDEADKEIGNSFCHIAILSGKIALSILNSI